MKKSIFRKIIREEIRRLLYESASTESKLTKLEKAGQSIAQWDDMPTVDYNIWTDSKWSEWYDQKKLPTKSEFKKYEGEIVKCIDTLDKQISDYKKKVLSIAKKYGYKP